MEKIHILNGEEFVAGSDGTPPKPQQIIKLEDALIVFCRKGHARIDIDLQKYEMTENTQIVLLPGSIICITEASDDISVSFVGLTHALFREITARLDPSFFRFLKENPCVTLPQELTQSIKRLSEALEDIYMDKDNCFQLQIAKNFIQSFLLDIYDKTHRMFMEKQPGGISRQEELFKSFIQLILKHCTTEREVSFYASELYITPRYLSSVIQNVANTTAKSIIDKHVILEIKALLKSTNLSIQEIANKLCFPDQSFFGRYFKKHTGMSPLQFRNMP